MTPDVWTWRVKRPLGEMHCKFSIVKMRAPTWRVKSWAESCWGREDEDETTEGGVGGSRLVLALMVVVSVRGCVTAIILPLALLNPTLLCADATAFKAAVKNWWHCVMSLLKRYCKRWRPRSEGRHVSKERIEWDGEDPLALMLVVVAVLMFSELFSFEGERIAADDRNLSMALSRELDC